MLKNLDIYIKSCANTAIPTVLSLLATVSILPALAKSSPDIFADRSSVQERLAHGEVVVGLKDVGNTKYVEARVLINEPPDKVWPIMVNPFEFEGKISPRMKAVEVMADQTNRSVLKITLDVLIMPHLSYVVESLYENGQSIEFHRVSGTLKDFRGSWVMNPADDGRKTELAYCMYIDPGFPVPQWIIREGVKNELPRTLNALRHRINTVSQHQAVKERRTILAALIKLPGHHSNQSINAHVSSSVKAELLKSADYAATLSQYSPNSKINLADNQQ